jgi:hypothetical protein
MTRKILAVLAIFVGVLGFALPASAADDPDLAAIRAIVGQGRYMDTSPPCGPRQVPATSICCASIDPALADAQPILMPYRDFIRPQKGHQGLQDCRYLDDSSTGIETRVIMLNPTPDRVAEWTISACRRAGAVVLTDCAQWMWDNVFKESGTQFPVTGAVAEPNGGCGADESNVGYLFRDGVTVRLVGVDHVCSGDKGWLKQDPSLFLWADVRWTACPGPGRIAMLTRQEYADFFNASLPDDHPVGGRIPWLVIVREAHLKALASTSHPWLDAIAVRRLPRELRALPH